MLISYYLRNALYSKVLGSSVVSKAFFAKHEGAWDSLRWSTKDSATWVVIGNGPSLAADDLGRIQHLPSIASNRINLIFDQTNWRPRIYTIADPLLASKMRVSDLQEYSTICCPRSIRSMLPSRDGKLVYRFGALRQVGGPNHPVKDGLLAPASITVNNIQLALFFGATKIILLGVDHSYQEEKSEKVRKLKHGSVSNHFSDKYRSPGEAVNNAQIGLITDQYLQVRDHAELNGCDIVNCSRLTALDVFRVSHLEQELV